MVVWEVRLKYIEAKDTYHLYRFEGGRWHFLVDFPPCDNVKDFIALLKKEDILLKWK